MSPITSTFSNAYGLAIAPSGHMLVSEGNMPGDALGLQPLPKNIIVLKANGELDFTIDVEAAGATGALTHLAVNPVTGRVYVSTNDPDNHIYMFDVPCLRSPAVKLAALPIPAPSAVSNAMTNAANADPNYQSILGDLATSDLQAAANNYANPNTTPSNIASVHTNTSITNVVHSHLSLLTMVQAPTGSQRFQASDHQYLANLAHGGVAAHMQKQSRGRKKTPENAQSMQRGAWLGEAPTLAFMNDLKNFSVWMQNAFSQTDNGVSPTVDANRARMQAWTFGADAVVYKKDRIGVFGGLSKTAVHLINTPLTQDNANKKYVGLYGLHFLDIKRAHVTPTVDANVMLGSGHINHARDLSISGYPQIATSHQGFWDLSTRFRLTVPHHLSEHLTVSPYAYAGWMYFKQNQVAEQGAGVFDQNRPAQIFQVAEGSLGTQLSASFDQSFGILMPSLKVGITQTNTINQQKVIPIALADGGTFESTQMPLKQFAYDVGGSLGFKWKNGLSFVASYLGEYGKNKYKRNEVLLEVRLYF